MSDISAVEGKEVTTNTRRVVAYERKSGPITEGDYGNLAGLWYGVDSPTEEQIDKVKKEIAEKDITVAIELPNPDHPQYLVVALDENNEVRARLNAFPVFLNMRQETLDSEGFWDFVGEHGPDEDGDIPALWVQNWRGHLGGDKSWNTAAMDMATQVTEIAKEYGFSFIAGTGKSEVWRDGNGNVVREKKHDARRLYQQMSRIRMAYPVDCTNLDQIDYSEKEGDLVHNIERQTYLIKCAAIDNQFGKK